MRIEGVIATAGMASQQLNQETPASHKVGRDVQHALAQAASAKNAAAEEQASVGDKMLNQAVEQIEKIVSAFDNKIAFQIHKDSQNTQVQVVNKQTGEIIREFPSDQILDMVAFFQKQLSGLLVDVSQ